ncbi:cytochrome c oxidase subunit II [Methylotetracoccus oryzae]|uniref:cytochrome c oxidase subunit II n=1 Tax=Methylotetracoccus oryzae TaxID=1919059 RepID=UPI001117D00C|nr:cytochrome c oxidase subunit II [Methylotetracoccus oryzae]
MTRHSPQSWLDAPTDRIQSVLHPQTPVAQLIADLGWVMSVGAVVIFVGVMVLAAYAVAGRYRERVARLRFIVGGGIALPLLVLSGLLTYSLVTASRIVEVDDTGAVQVHVIGHQFWWEVHYLKPDGTIDAATANEVHVPTGQVVHLQLTAQDVIHSFWIPNLAGKLDMIPGRTNMLRLRVDQPGTWRGQCAEYCGAQHARMAFHLTAQPPADFANWLAAQRRLAALPKEPFLQRGEHLFLSADCGQQECCADCHTIRGTSARGEHGPDLTHVGSRHWIAAGTLPNNAGTLAGWIASSQHLKTGSHMPSFDRYSGEDLRALAGYLASLE